MECRQRLCHRPRRIIGNNNLFLDCLVAHAEKMRFLTALKMSSYRLLLPSDNDSLYKMRVSGGSSSFLRNLSPRPRSPLNWHPFNLITSIHHHYHHYKSPPLLSKTGILIVLLLLTLYSFLILPSFHFYYNYSTICSLTRDGVSPRPPAGPAGEFGLLSLDEETLEDHVDDWYASPQPANVSTSTSIPEKTLLKMLSILDQKTNSTIPPATRPTSATQTNQSTANSTYEHHSIDYDHPLIVHMVKVFPHPQDTKVWNITIMQYIAILGAWKALSKTLPLAMPVVDVSASSNSSNTSTTSPTPSPLAPLTANHSLVVNYTHSPLPLAIYLHSNLQPVGKYWEHLLHNQSVNIVWLDAQRITKFGNVETAAMEHEADFHKINRTHFYGGIHIDFDVFLINGTKIRELQRRGECVLSVDVDIGLARGYGEKRMFNAGFFSCVKHSPYLQLWRNNYASDYRRGSFLYNSGVFPTKLANDYPYPLAEDWQIGMHWRPELLREPGFGSSEWLNMTGIHFYHLEHEHIDWQQHMLNSSSVFAQVARYIQFGTAEAVKDDRMFP